MKFLETLKKYQQQILVVLFLLLLLKGCGTNSEVTKLRKEVETQREVLNNLPTKKDLQIELAPIKSDINLMKWMLGAILGLAIANFAKQFL